MMEKPRRFDGCHISFSQTGVSAVDKILSSVAFAAKGYHHTEGWSEEIADYGDNVGGSYEAWIENSAKECAKEIETLRKDRGKLVKALRHYANRMDSGGTARATLKELGEME